MKLTEQIIPWTPEEAKHHHNTAVQCFRHDYDHGITPDPDNCGGCAIRGLGTEDGKPNYCGWARCYVEAGISMPLAWKADFEAELNSGNAPYALALKRSIATFGKPTFHRES